MELLNPRTIIHHVAPWDNWWVTIIWFAAIKKNKRHILCGDFTVTDSKNWTSWISFCFHRKKTPLKKLLPPPPVHGCTHSFLLCKGLAPKSSTPRFSSMSCLYSITCSISQLHHGPCFHFPHQIPAPSSDFTHTRISGVLSKITLLGEDSSYLKFHLS